MQVTGQFPALQTTAANWHVRSSNKVMTFAARELLLKTLEQRNEIWVSVLNWLLELLAWTWAETGQYRD